MVKQTKTKKNTLQCDTTLNVLECQVYIKKQTNQKTTNIGKDLEKWESLYIFVETVKFAVAVEKEFGGSSEI